MEELELRITRTEDNADMFDEVCEISFMISVYKNPHLFWGFGDMPEAERFAEITRLEDLFKELTH